MGLETVGLEKRVQKGEVLGKVGLEDRTGKKDVESFITDPWGTQGVCE